MRNPIVLTAAVFTKKKTQKKTECQPHSAILQSNLNGFYMDFLVIFLAYSVHKIYF